MTQQKKKIRSWRIKPRQTFILLHVPLMQVTLKMALKVRLPYFYRRYHGLQIETSAFHDWSLNNWIFRIIINVFRVIAFVAYVIAYVTFILYCHNLGWSFWILKPDFSNQYSSCSPAFHCLYLVSKNSFCIII